MKSLTKLTTWVAALAIGLGCASKADAVMLTIGGAGYVGYYTPGNASGTDEPLIVNELIALAVNTSQASTEDASQTLFRGSIDFSPLTLPTASSPDKEDSGDVNDRVVGSDSAYILGKYGNDGTIGQVAHVWYIGNIAVGEAVVLPDATGDGLSHSTVMAGTRSRVPEGGTTLVLIGMALVSIGVAKKRLVS